MLPSERRHSEWCHLSGHSAGTYPLGGVAFVLNRALGQVVCCLQRTNGSVVFTVVVGWWVALSFVYSRRG